MSKEVSYFQHLNAKADKRSNVSELFLKRTTALEKTLLTRFLYCKPHTVGEALLPATKQIVDIMQGEGLNIISESVPLSNNTVPRQTDKMATDFESKLTNLFYKKLNFYCTFMNQLYLQNVVCKNLEQ